MWSSIQLVSVLGWLLVLVAYVATQFGYLSAKGLAFAYANIVGSGILAVVAALEDRHELYLADKGFACVGWERHWAYEQGSLVVATPKDNSKRAWSRSDRLWAGPFTRLAAKVAAYTCRQRLNGQLGRPLRHLADLLV